MFKGYTVVEQPAQSMQHTSRDILYRIAYKRCACRQTDMMHDISSHVIGTRYVLDISCKNLLANDALGKADPVVAIFGGKDQLLDHTEMVV